ncbi:MAG: hypothetical protein EXR79_04835 [Myxococcales bacterium]|nr:hypothetical protein [Myxococcales bacterium]
MTTTPRTHPARRARATLAARVVAGCALIGCTEELPADAEFKYQDALPPDGAAAPGDDADGTTDGEGRGADGADDDAAGDADDATVGGDSDAPADTADPCAAGCADDNPCTDDACDAALGCVHLANAASCSDSDACTTGDTCKSSACGAGFALGCDDGNPCTQDTCDKTTGCAALPTEGTCTLADLCLVDGTCVEAKCTGGKAKFCNDGNACTDNGCQSTSGCVFLPSTASCVDDDLCTDATACKDGKCSSGAPTKCDDGDPCTADSCLPAVGCAAKAVGGAACDDKDTCTESDVCGSDGKCKGKAKPCDDGNACTNDACTDGACKGVPVSDGVTCTIATECAVAEGCIAGTCAAAEALWESQLGGPQSDGALDVIGVAGGIVVVGVRTDSGDPEAFIAKVSPSGALVWEKTFGGKGDDGGQALAVQKDGTIGVAAFSVSQGSGDYDTVLLQYSPVGTLAGKAVIGGKPADRPYRLEALAAGGWALAGESAGGVGGSLDLWLVKLKADGTKEFDKVYGTGGDDHAYGLAVLAEGYALSGSTPSPDNGTEFTLVRTDANGTKMFQKTYGTPGTDDGAVLVALADGFLLAGSTTGKGAGKSDAWLVRTDLAGVKLWDRAIGSEGNDAVAGLAILPGDAGSIAGFALAGVTGDDVTKPNGWLLAVDPNGNLVWQQKLGAVGLDKLAAVRLGTDPVVAAGGLLAAGQREVASLQAWVVRADVWGNKSCSTGKACVKTPPVTCDDTNPCTTDVCLPGKGCAHFSLAAGSSCGVAKTCNADAQCGL